uniref:Chromosome 1 open reading frame 167 n=1 Tax=Papio anubis TaxID=9555 RepID=A0A096N972_PAPAN
MTWMSCPWGSCQWEPGACPAASGGTGGGGMARGIPGVGRGLQEAALGVGRSQEEARLVEEAQTPMMLPQDSGQRVEEVPRDLMAKRKSLILHDPAKSVPEVGGHAHGSGLGGAKRGAARSALPPTTCGGPSPGGNLSSPRRAHLLKQTRPLTVGWTKDTPVPEPMELRSDASHKENVSPKPAVLLKPGKRLRGFRRNLGISLSSRHDQWVPGCQVERGGRAATPSPGAVLDQEPCRVQTNLASPGPRLGLALKDTTGQLVNSSVWQQSNLQPPARRCQGKAREFAIQQSNLSSRETSSPHLCPEPGGSFGPHKLPWGRLLSQEPLARPSPCLRQSRLPAPGTPSGDFRPTEAFAPLDGHTRPGLRFWGGLGSWRSRLVGEPLTLEDLAIPSQNQTRAPSHAAIQQLLASVRCLAQEAARLRCQAPQELPPWGVPPKQKGEEGAPRERVHREEERTAFHLPDTIPASNASKNKAQNIVAPESEATCWQLLSRCFRSWRHLVKRQSDPVVAAVALGRWQLLRKGLQALWLREAQLEAACGRYTKILLAWSFQEVRSPQVGPGGCVKHYPGSLREEERAQWLLSRPGQRTDSRDERVQILEALQLAVFFLWCQQKERARQERESLQKATRATQTTGSFPHAWHFTAAGTAWVAPLSPQHQRAWLCRCFGAWQQFVQRGSRYRDHLADRRTGTLRKCLEQWVRMKQLRDSDGAKVTQLSLCRQKAGREALHTAGPAACGLGTVGQAQGLQEQGRGSLQDACRTLALCRALLLWKTRLFQCQWANSFLQGLQQRMLQRSLRWWHVRALGPDATSSCTKIPSAPEPMGSSTSQGSLEKVPRAPALPETLQGSLLWAAGQRQQGQCFRLWRARAWQFQGTARWYQHTLQRRIFLSWSRWATAQGAWRELASHWAWDRSCRAVLGLWRRRLLQLQLVDRWAQERGWRLARDALCHWHSSWQGQQFLHEKCQTWVQGHLQGLQRAVLWSWQQAAARQRCTVTRPEQLLLQSYFQAWCEVVRDTGVLRAQRQAFQDDLRRRALGAVFATWREAQAAAAGAQEQRVAQASLAHWRICGQQGQEDGQPKKAQAPQAFPAWPVAPDVHREAQQQEGESAGAQAARCWTRCWALWAPSCRGQVSQAHASWKLRAWVLEASTQSGACGGVQRAIVTQLRQAGLRRFLQMAQLRVRLGLRAKTRSCWTQATGLVPPAPSLQCSLGGQRKPRGTAWAQRCEEHSLCPAFQLWPQWPGQSSWVPGLPLWMRDQGPRGHSSPEPRALKAQSEAHKRRLGILEKQAQAHGSALLPALKGHDALGHQEEVPAAPVCGGRKAEGLATAGEHERKRPPLPTVPKAQRVAPEIGLADVVAADPATASGSAVKAAFKKWHQRLAARSPRRGAASSPRPWSKPGPKGPESGQKLPEPRGAGGLGQIGGAQLPTSRR